ncbi:hypothetical protein [uncultured Tenacibaculum sp.]|uniref:hypothetical protein n=1 Tax=uncultured Tenacibaculum sp. TaxID=174713 RepID=UPI00261D6736|nr:hypothetical protein [uncultured Tenacibaculum sp.]
MSLKNTINNIVLIVLIVFISCTNNEKEKKDLQAVIKETKKEGECPEYLLKNKKNNLNISILLDLSDRIDEKKYPNTSMEYFQRDLGYINSISNSFLEHIQNKKLVLINDDMQIYFEPAPANITINQKSKELKVSFTKNLTKELIENTKKKYTTIPKEIYTLAKENGKYLGSDTWRFFKDKAKRYCIKECNRNILVILTDGYMFHTDTKLKEKNLTSFITPRTLRNFGLNNSRWEETFEKKGFGFIPASKKLNNLEVLVIGLVNHDKKRNPYSQDVVKKYWSKWLENMGIKKYEIYGAELPSNMDNTIRNFILN